MTAYDFEQFLANPETFNDVWTLRIGHKNLKELYESKQSISASLPMHFKITYVHSKLPKLSKEDIELFLRLSPTDSDDVEKLHIFGPPTGSLYIIK